MRKKEQENEKETKGKNSSIQKENKGRSKRKNACTQYYSQCNITKELCPCMELSCDLKRRKNELEGEEGEEKAAVGFRF